jgi:uncharacterized protein (TIGR02452 family)
MIGKQSEPDDTGGMLHPVGRRCSGAIVSAGSVNRRLRQIAAETVEIVQAGGYRSSSGRWVDIAEAVAHAVGGTRLHLPDETLPAPLGSESAPLVEVSNESTLGAGRRLGPGTVVLVFASARNPGGGFITGARAQEEDIARASALYACLTAAPDFYAHHRREPDLRYSDRVIYSPEVPVFRDDTGRLLDRPYLLSMITAAAPNLSAIRSNQPDLADTVPDVVRKRCQRVLEVAAARGHRQLVLGAWGCGVFGNDPTVVATAFAEALRRVTRFDHVVFAVLDHTPATARYRAFVDTIRPGLP